MAEPTAFPTLDPAHPEVAGKPPILWAPTGQYFVSDGAHWIPTVKGAPAIPQRSAFPAQSSAPSPAPAPKGKAPQSRDDVIDRLLGTVSTPKASQKGPQSRTQAIQALLDQPDMPTPPPEPSKVPGQIKNLANLPKLITEGLPAAGRAFEQHQMDPTPTYGQQLRGGPLGYTPIPNILDIAARIGRLPGSLGAAVSKLGPEKAEPLTKAIVEQLPFLPWSSLLKRPPVRPGAPADLTQPAPPAQRALPPVTRGERVPPAYDAEGQLIRDRFTPEGTPRALPGQPGPAGELPPHIDWQPPPPSPKMLLPGVPRKRGAIIAGEGEKVGPEVSQTGRRILPSDELAERFGIEMEKPGVPQAAPGLVDPLRSSKDRLAAAETALTEASQKFAVERGRLGASPDYLKAAQTELLAAERALAKIEGRKPSIKPSDFEDKRAVSDASRSFGPRQAVPSYRASLKAPKSQQFGSPSIGHVRLYHGTSRQFSEFQDPRIAGTYFTRDPDIAGAYAKEPPHSPEFLVGKERQAGPRLENVGSAPNVYALDIPEHLIADPRNYERMPSPEQLKGMGFAGYKNYTDDYVIFEPNRWLNAPKINSRPTAPRMEQTPEGMQGLIEGTPSQSLQLAPQESAIFKQQKGAAREAELAKAQGDLPDPQRAAVQEWLADQLDVQGQLALAKAKTAAGIPPSVQKKLQALGIDPADAWNVSHAPVPKADVMERLLAKAIPAKGALSSHPAPPSPTGSAPGAAASETYDALLEGLSGALEKIPGRGSSINRAEEMIRGLHKAFDETGQRLPTSGKLGERIAAVEEALGPDQFDKLVKPYSLAVQASRPPSRFLGASTQGFEHGVPNLDNPKDLYQIVRGAGGIKVTEDLRGELKALPTWAKNKKGQTLDQIAESLADQYPHLGDRQAIKEKIADNLGNYDTLKEQVKARSRIPEPDPMVTELHTGTPPSDIPVDPAEWKTMGPMQRKSAIDFFREAFTDESGRLNLADMMKALRRFRTKFPMEEAVRQARPNSPVIAETERWTTGLSDGIALIAESPWWKAVRKMNPDDLKDLEQRMVDVWTQGGKTPASYTAALRLAPPEVQQAMRHRQAGLMRENASRRWFGLPEIPEQMGPYLPRQVEEESLSQVTLGAGSLGAGRGRGPQTTVGPHAKSRTFETYRQGEQQGGLEYEDPRNAVLMREWQGVKLRSTHRLFKNLEDKGGLFRTEQQARAASPTGDAWKIKNAPGGEWWTATESEARFLRDNLSESAKGPLTSLVGYGNALLRNPNLVNPAPHVLKNMMMKALLARGPVTPYVMARDAVEYFRKANPNLIREFNEAMPFSASGKVAGDILGGELRSGTVADGVRAALRTLGKVNRPSQKIIFEWADPAMRYSLFKHYRGQGMGVYEAGNHAWVDLVRYGTRSSWTDFWKSMPLNFFVPWRYGTFVSLVKQVKNHPIRTALLLGAADYAREVRYRQTGRWFHVPWDYVEGPLAQAVQSRNLKELGRNLGSQAALTALFGPGGGFAASQIDDMLKLAQGRGDQYEYERLSKMFWGLGQLYDVSPWGTGTHGGVSGVLGSLLLGEHNALTYEPRRLGRAYSESLPGMRKSALVREAEEMQGQRQEKIDKRDERRKDKPRNTIEDRLRAGGYLK